MTHTAGGLPTDGCRITPLHNTFGDAHSSKWHEVARWLNIEAEGLSKHSAAKQQSLAFILSRVVVLSTEVLAHEPRGKSPLDLRIIFADDAARLATQHAAYAFHTYTPPRNFLLRLIGRWRSDQVNHGWDSAVLPGLTRILHR